MVVKEAYEMLENSDINFIGNAEIVDIPNGVADVIVCDGFVGNTILKLTEGLSKALFKIIKSEITSGVYKLAAAALKTPFSNIKRPLTPIRSAGAVYRAQSACYEGAWKL